MGNISNGMCPTIITSEQSDAYKLISNDKVYKSYKLFITTCNDKLTLTITSLLDGMTYITNVNLTDLKKMELFLLSETIDDIKTAIEKNLKEKSLRIVEESTNIKLAFITMRNDKPVPSIFNLTLKNNQQKVDTSTTI
jgi:hypothetical protein